MTEKHSTVPYQFQATLEQYRSIDRNPADQSYRTNPKINVESKMSISSTLHPEDYTYFAAHQAALDYLKPLLDLGWRIKSLQIWGYGSK